MAVSDLLPGGIVVLCVWWWAWVVRLAYSDAFCVVMVSIWVMLWSRVSAFGDARVVAFRAVYPESVVEVVGD
mgnify:CR=1 FL=1